MKTASALTTSPTSGLYHTAATIPVYASPESVTRSGATLARPGVDRTAGFRPARWLRKVSALLLPPFPGLPRRTLSVETHRGGVDGTLPSIRIRPPSERTLSAIVFAGPIPSAGRAGGGPGTAPAVALSVAIGIEEEHPERTVEVEEKVRIATRLLAFPGEQPLGATIGLLLER